MDLVSRLLLRAAAARRTRARVDRDYRIENVRAQLIRRLKALVPELRVTEGEAPYEVRVVFCPIVSRMGTDIEAVLSRVKGDKVTIVIVLHHTMDRQAVIPSSSVYERPRVILVDFLFFENQGLLDCPKNDAAFTKAAHYLKLYASPVPKEHGLKKYVPFLVILGFGVVVFWSWNRYRLSHRRG